MASPPDPALAVPSPTPPPSPPARKGGRPGRVWVALWAACSMLLVLAAVMIWIWAGTAGSLAHTLGWLQHLTHHRSDTLGAWQVNGAEGSLRQGGRLATVRWRLGELSVAADGVQLRWDDGLWTDLLRGRGLHLAVLDIERLQIDDQRPPTPSEPLVSLTLPLPVSLGLSVQQVELRGRTALSLSQIRAHYRYGEAATAAEPTAQPGSTPGAATHHLRIDSLQLADGRYQGALRLKAAAPMALTADLLGDLHTPVPEGTPQHLQAQASVRGTLSGTDAVLDLHAQLTPATPNTDTAPTALKLQANLMPWRDMPWVRVDLQAQGLNLASVWPSAPVSALNGSVQAQPQGDGWQADVVLENRRAGAADQGFLPVQSLSLRVHHQGDHWRFTGLRARLGGGQLQGEGRFVLPATGARRTPTQWQGELSFQGLQPGLLWTPWTVGALDGKLSARAAPQAGAPQAVQLSARIEPSAAQPSPATQLQKGQAALQGRGLWRPAAHGPHGELQLDDAQVSLLGMQLSAHGRLHTAQPTWTGPLRLDLPGAQLALEGTLAHADGQGELQLTLSDAARLREGLRAAVRLPQIGPAIQTALVQADALRPDGSASARLRWTGGLGALGWPAPPGATPAPTPLRVDSALQIPRLQWHSGAGAPLTLRDLQAQASGPLDALQWRLQGSASAAPWLATLTAEGHGTGTPTGGQLSVHPLALSLQVTSLASAPAVQRWRADLPEPLRLRWQHQPDAGWHLDAAPGALQLRLDTPPAAAPSAASSARLSPATPLTLRWQRLAWQDHTVLTEGSLQGINLPWLDALAAIGGLAPGAAVAVSGPLAAHGLSGDLVLDAQWQARLPLGTPAQTAAGPRTEDGPSLLFTLERRSGDLRWQTPAAGGANHASAASTPLRPTLQAGISDARISLRLQDRDLVAQLRWETERLGQVRADFRSRLSPSGSATGGDVLEAWWPADAPIQGSAQVRLPEVGVWSLFAPPGWRMSGTLLADATLGGTRSAPDWRGRLQGDELSLRSVVDGIALGQGQLRATLAGERITVERFSLQGQAGQPSGGRLDASGLAEWRVVPGSRLRQPHIELQARAQSLRVSSRPDRRLTLSGDLSATLSGALLQLRGQLKADAALFILPDEMAPSLDDDVVVRHAGAAAPDLTGGPQRVRPDVAISLDLGPSFEVRGLGAQTRLQGQLRVLSTPNAPTPRVLGEVRAVNGTYRAYGQQLDIETGVLRFTGPYDDPALDIRAVRKLPENSDQRVGVVMSGHAQAPRLSLFAEPDLPDADKLAWLVLGRPASASGAQAFVLQQAARRLLSRGGEPLDGSLARSLGLDEIGFNSGADRFDGTPADAALTLGKRLSQDLYLSYEQSVTGAMSTVSILYDISRRLTLRARAGTENAIDLIFTHRYD